MIGKTHSKSSKELNQTGKQKEEKIRDPREKKAEDWRLSYAMAVLKSVMLKVTILSKYEYVNTQHNPTLTLKNNGIVDVVQSSIELVNSKSIE